MQWCGRCVYSDSYITIQKYISCNSSSWNKSYKSGSHGNIKILCIYQIGSRNTTDIQCCSWVGFSYPHITIQKYISCNSSSWNKSYKSGSHGNIKILCIYQIGSRNTTDIQCCSWVGFSYPHITIQKYISDNSSAWNESYLAASHRNIVVLCIYTYIRQHVVLYYI